MTCDNPCFKKLSNEERKNGTNNLRSQGNAFYKKTSGNGTWRVKLEEWKRQQDHFSTNIIYYNFYTFI